jgi:hypothetical protein
MVEHEALSSIPRTTKKKRKEGRKEGRCGNKIKRKKGREDWMEGREGARLTG